MFNDVMQTHNFGGTPDSNNDVQIRNSDNHTNLFGDDSASTMQSSRELNHITEDINKADAILDSTARNILSYRAVAARLIYLILNDPELTYEDVLEAIPARGEGSDLERVKVEARDYLTGNEIHVIYDVLFKTLKTPKLRFDFYIDLEPQGNYNMPYSLASRGIVYLSKLISSQVDIRTRKEAKNYQDYDKVVKCYSVWLCFDKLLDEKQHSVCGITRYKMQPCIGEGLRFNEDEAAHADLMELIIVRAGIPTDISLNSELLDCVNTFFKYTDNLSKYINSKTICTKINEEVNNMSSFIEKMCEERELKGIINTYFKFNVPASDIVSIIMKEFNLPVNVAKDYVNKYQINAQH